MFCVTYIGLSCKTNEKQSFVVLKENSLDLIVVYRTWYMRRERMWHFG